MPTTGQDLDIERLSAAVTMLEKKITPWKWLWSQLVIMLVGAFIFGQAWAQMRHELEEVGELKEQMYELTKATNHLSKELSELRGTVSANDKAGRF